MIPRRVKLNFCMHYYKTLAFNSRPACNRSMVYAFLVPSASIAQSSGWPTRGTCYMHLQFSRSSLYDSEEQSLIMVAYSLIIWFQLLDNFNEVSSS